MDVISFSGDRRKCLLLDGGVFSGEWRKFYNWTGKVSVVDKGNFLVGWGKF